MVLFLVLVVATIMLVVAACLVNLRRRPERFEGGGDADPKEAVDAMLRYVEERRRKQRQEPSSQ